MTGRDIERAQQNDQEFQSRVREAAGTGGGTDAEQIARLAELRDAGTLTETEFQQAKAKILEFPPMVPLQRYGTEAEISSAIVYLLSPAASYITGSCIRVDGGTPNFRPAYWKLQPSRNNEPFEGFHRAVLPDLLIHGLPKS